MALEKDEAGSRYHATAEEAITFKQIAVAVGVALRLPVVAVSPDDAAGHFGWLSAFAGKDMSASSAKTQKELGWHPTGPGLLADISVLEPVENEAARIKCLVSVPEITPLTQRA